MGLLAGLAGFAGTMGELISAEKQKAAERQFQLDLLEETYKRIGRNQLSTEALRGQNQLEVERLRGQNQLDVEQLRGRNQLALEQLRRAVTSGGSKPAGFTLSGTQSNNISAALRDYYEAKAVFNQDPTAPDAAAAVLAARRALFGHLYAATGGNAPAAEQMLNSLLGPQKDLGSVINQVIGDSSSPTASKAADDPSDDPLGWLNPSVLTDNEYATSMRPPDVERMNEQARLEALRSSTSIYPRAFFGGYTVTPNLGHTSINVVSDKPKEGSDTKGKSKTKGK
jgi:hypothetical protein